MGSMQWQQAWRASLGKKLSAPILMLPCPEVVSAHLISHPLHLPFCRSSGCLRLMPPFFTFQHLGLKHTYLVQILICIGPSRVPR